MWQTKFSSMSRMKYWISNGTYAFDVLRNILLKSVKTISKNFNMLKFGEFSRRYSHVLFNEGNITETISILH